MKKKRKVVRHESDRKNEGLKLRKRKCDDERPRAAIKEKKRKGQTKKKKKQIKKNK